LKNVLGERMGSVVWRKRMGPPDEICVRGRNGDVGGRLQEHEEGIGGENGECNEVEGGRKLPVEAVLNEKRGHSDDLSSLGMERFS
jgi:hypothetical protein